MSLVAILGSGKSDFLTNVKIDHSAWISQKTHMPEMRGVFTLSKTYLWLFYKFFSWAKVSTANCPFTIGSAMKRYCFALIFSGVRDWVKNYARSQLIESFKRYSIEQYQVCNVIYACAPHELLKIVNLKFLKQSKLTYVGFRHRLHRIKLECFTSRSFYKQRTTKNAISGRWRVQSKRNTKKYVIS